MPRDLPRNVRRELNRHGKEVYYYREGNGARYRLPERGSREFMEAVAAARNGEPIPHVRDLSITKRGQQQAAVHRTISLLLARAKRRAAAKGWSFDLDTEWAISECERTDYRCPLTNIPFMLEGERSSFMNPYVPSFDRINSAGGYTKENVRIVIFAVNAMISDWGENVMHRVANGYRYVKNKKRRGFAAPK